MNRLFGDNKILETPSIRCSHCGDSFIPIRSTQKYCSSRCQRRQDEEKYKSKTIDSTSSRGRYRKIILETLGSKCSKCNSDNLKDLHAHHKIPSFLGGSNHIDNITLLCSKCHSALHVALMKELRFKDQSALFPENKAE